MTLKHFRPDLFVQLQHFTDSAAMLWATQEWDRATKAYAQDLKGLRPQLPPSALRLIDDFVLHDAEVLAAGQANDRFFILLQLEQGPGKLLQLTYYLAQGAKIDRDVFPSEYRTDHAEWLYDELSMSSAGGRTTFTHDILFSDGMALTIPFTDLDVTQIDSWYSVASTPGTAGVVVGQESI